MKIMVPVSSVFDAVAFAKMKIDEIYVGVESPDYFNMKTVTFTGRFKNVHGRKAQLKNFDELKEVVEICHKQGIHVNFTANVRNLSNNFNNQYIEYIERALKQGVDAIIVGSIAGLIIVNEKKYDIPIHTSTFFYPFNKHYVDFFHKFNVKRIIMPTALSLNELKHIKEYILKKDYDMEMEVFSQFGCSNINGRCNIFYKAPGICRGKFDIYNDKDELIMEDYNFLDAGKDCSICSLKELNDIGIDCLKILGRGLPFNVVGSIAKIYQEALKQTIQGKDLTEIRKRVIEKVNWWNKGFCMDDRCLYRNTEISEFYV